MEPSVILTAQDREKLSTSFKELASLYGQISDKHRQGAFDLVSTILKHHPGVIQTGHALRKIPGIGKSSVEIIDEWVKTGKIKRLEDLRIKVVSQPEKILISIKSPEELEKKKTLDLFEQIHGVGPKIAEKWYQQGWRTLDDIKLDQLTHAQQIGLQNFASLQEKIPRSEIDLFQQYLKIMLPRVKFEICGSYRRGVQESGDIDLLLMKTEGYTLEYIVEQMMARNLIIAKLSSGPTKFMGLIRLGPGYKSRRLDIRWVNPEAWSFATLYFTGCKTLNIKMRQKAITMGLNLSEYCLAKSSGEKIICQTEPDIFRALEMGYLSPTERT